MIHWHGAELRLFERVLEVQPLPIQSTKRSHISILADCLEEALEAQGFRVNGKTILEALDHFESLHFEEVFINDPELHALFFDIANYILKDQYQLDLLRKSCNERNVYIRKRTLESHSALGGAAHSLPKREMLAEVLKAYDINLSPDTVLALARREYRRRSQSTKVGRPESYTIEQLKEMASLPGHENRAKRSNARQALKRRGVPEAEIPTVITEYRVGYSEKG